MSNSTRLFVDEYKFLYGTEMRMIFKTVGEENMGLNGVLDHSSLQFLVFLVLLQFIKLWNELLEECRIVVIILQVGIGLNVLQIK